MNPYFMGIDASKGYADFVICDKKQHVVEAPFQLDDTFEGHARLYAIAQQVLEADPDGVLFAAAESTGGYENNWLAALERFQATLPVKSARLNPTPVHQYARSCGCRITTDAISARHIAGYMIAHADKIDYSREDAYSSLRRHFSFIELLVKQKSALLNQLEKLIYCANPELLRYMRDETPQWILKLLTSYPTARRLRRARPGTVAKIPYITHKRAEALVAAARLSVASACDEHMEMLVIETATEILRLIHSVDKQKDALQQRLDLPKEVEILKSFTGIATYTAVGLLLEFGSIARFASSKQIASFYGVHPTFKISGDGVGGVRMSKRGSPRVRAMLFMSMWSATQTNPIIAPLYRRLRSEGRSRSDAIGVCMHKSLRILYGMLKNNTHFDPAIDQANRRICKKRKPRPADKYSRRHQNFDQSAPVSRRAKKRRQQKHSQSEIVTEYGMKTSTAVTGPQRTGSHNCSPKSRPQHS